MDKNPFCEVEGTELEPLLGVIRGLKANENEILWEVSGTELGGICRVAIGIPTASSDTVLVKLDLEEGEDKGLVCSPLLS